MQRYENVTKSRPEDKRAWLRLARAELNVAATGENFDRATGRLSDRSKGAITEGTVGYELFAAVRW